MKLAGIIIICFGFLVVLFPENWPDALHRLIRYEKYIFYTKFGLTIHIFVLEKDILIVKECLVK